MTIRSDSQGNAGFVLDSNCPRGYRRTSEGEELFQNAVQNLIKNLPDATKPWPSDGTLRCDLALEGGGVKGIALVAAVLVLDEAGYKVQRVAGTSAGAIAACLIAALVQAGQDLTKLKTYVDSLQFKKFMPQSMLHRVLNLIPGSFGNDLWCALKLTTNTGLYSGDYLTGWLGPKLKELNVETFAQLKITDDKDMSLPPERQYRLVVNTSDITRGELVRLPWDADYYVKDPEAMSVVEAVRASMSIPFFFRPVVFRTEDVTVFTPGPGGTTFPEHYKPGTVSWVDGGMLENFPIDAFGRIDDKPPRWPTIGLKLSNLETDYGPTKQCTSTPSEAVRCLKTMMNEWDRYSVEQETAARTIFIDNAGISATQFDLTEDEQNTLFRNGVQAATDFILEMGAYGHVPNTAAEEAELVRWRKAVTIDSRKRGVAVQKI
jgi:NTE family protein